MRKIFVAVIACLVLASPALPQTGKPLKLDPVRSVETLLVNELTNAVLFLAVPPMVDPVIDQGSTTFSYFAQPVYQLGLPGRHFATMVTPEGHLFNGSAELVFFTRGLKEINHRLYTLLDGWLPCIQYQLAENGIIYKVEAFQYWLDGEYGTRPVNFIRMTATNSGPRPAKAGLAVGHKFGTKDHRSQDMVRGNFNRFWTYEFKGNAAVRAGKIIYYFDEKPSRQWEMQGSPWREGKFFVLERWRVNSMVEYEFDLAPSESRSFTFKFPQEPVAQSPGAMAELSAADYSTYLNAMTKFWALAVSKGMTISLAEPKVVNASRAALVHNIMCQEYPKPDEIYQTVNRFQYNRFWLRDGSFFARMYALWGNFNDSQKLLRHFLSYQDESGNFISQPGQLDGFGQSLWAFGEYIRLSNDREFAKEILPAVKKAIAWFEDTTTRDPYGLMPPTSAMDNEFIIGRYTGHNFWALAGIDGAITVANAAGDKAVAEGFKSFRKKFADNLFQRVSEAARRNHGRIPPGMDVPLGVDWGNLFEVYPENFIAPDDPLLVSTFNHYRARHYKEGIATYRRSMHHYVTERVTEMSIRQGDQQNALADLYSMLVHTGSCHQGFEWTIFPWSSRDYCAGLPGACNFPPHGWYAALYNTLLRNMLVREEDNNLHLLSVVSPEWVRPGDEIAVNHAPTYFGMVSFKAKAEVSALKVSINTDFRRPPRQLVIHFPFFAEVSQVIADGRAVEFKPWEVRLSPEVSRVEIFWKLRPEPAYSYQAFAEAYQREYARRYSRLYK